MNLLHGMKKETVALLIQPSEQYENRLVEEVKRNSNEKVLKKEIKTIFEKLPKKNRQEILTSLEPFIEKKAGELPQLYKERFCSILSGTVRGTVGVFGAIFGIIAVSDLRKAWCNNSVDSVYNQIHNNTWNCFVPQDCQWDSHGKYSPVTDWTNTPSIFMMIFAGLGIIPVCTYGAVENFKEAFTNIHGKRERYRWQLAYQVLYELQQKNKKEGE